MDKMRRNKINKAYAALNIILPIVSLVAIAAIYAIISKAVDIELIVPSVGATAKSFFELLGKGYFYKAVFNTLLRSALAYILAFAVAACFAALTSYFKVLRSAFSPFVVIIRVLPTMSLILLALIWFDSFQSTVLVAFCVIFPMLYTCLIDAIDGVDKDLLQMAKIYGVGKGRTVAKLYIPQMLPGVLTGVKSSAALNFKLVIAAEVLAQTADSIGVNMQLAKLDLDTATLLAWTVAAIVIGGIIELAISFIAKRAVRWL